MESGLKGEIGRVEAILRGRSFGRINSKSSDAPPNRSKTISIMSADDGPQVRFWRMLMVCSWISSFSCASLRVVLLVREGVTFRFCRRGDMEIESNVLAMPVLLSLIATLGSRPWCRFDSNSWRAEMSSRMMFFSQAAPSESRT